MPKLLQMLEKYEIPVNTWGNGEAKRVEHLLDEINQKETKFRFLHGQLIRCICPVVIDVYYRLTRDSVLHLRETKQEFFDGRVRRIHRDTSVSEKAKHLESPIMAARRGLGEELGFSSQADYSLAEVGHDCVLTNGTQSFPHLPTFRQRHFFVCVISRNIYDSNGYTEAQPGVKVVHFEWQPMPIREAKSFMAVLIQGKIMA